MAAFLGQGSLSLVRAQIASNLHSMGDYLAREAILGFRIHNFPCRQCSATIEKGLLILCWCKVKDENFAKLLTSELDNLKIPAAGALFPSAQKYSTGSLVFALSLLRYLEAKINQPFGSSYANKDVYLLMKSSGCLPADWTFSMKMSLSWKLDVLLWVPICNQEN